MSMSPESESEFKVHKVHNGMKFVFGLLAVSFIMGLYAFYNFKVANQVLRLELVSMETRGKELSFSQCIDQVVDWVPKCAAMKSLCEAYSGGIMEACLKGRNRMQECAQIADRPDVSHFGFQDCEARNLNRALNKVCANAYKALDIHCKNNVLGG